MKRQLSHFFLILCIMLLTIGWIMQKQDTQTSTNAEENTMPRFVYKVPGMDNVIIKKDIGYFAEGETRLAVDMYYPPGFNFKSIFCPDQF